MTDIKHKTGPKVQMQDEAPPVAEESQATPKPALLPMDSAPKGGETIILSGSDGVEIAAKWHKTRRFQMAPTGGSWVEDGWWRFAPGHSRGTPNDRVPFEPAGWRKAG